MAEMWENLQETWGAFLRYGADAWHGVATGMSELSSRLHPAYMLVFVLIAFALFLSRRRADKEASGSFWSFLFPRAAYFSRSSLVDLQLFIFSRALIGLRVLTAFAAPAGTAIVVIAMLSMLTGTMYDPDTPTSAGMMALAGLLVVVASDFCVYWVHRVHHEHPVLWPFHAVHHSAETMTPLTVYRKHPVYDLFSNTARGLLIGSVQGVLLFCLVGHISPLAIGGINALYVIFNMAGANLRHTHIWLDYGPVLDRIFISPAQHQIHHSRAPAHHDTNYGEIFALWDWMFGSLYVPKGKEELEFGLADANGVPLPQPHGTFREALLRPFADSFRAWRGPKGAAPPGLNVADRQEPSA